MTGWIRKRSIISLLVILLLSLPLASFAQDPAQDDVKKDDRKDKKDEELPLKTDSKIEFTTDEGTWTSLDISPDGKTVIFDMLGDIYTMPASGGEAKRIIGGLSFESQPKFSPDGKKMVFVSDRSGAENLWLADADGSNLKPLTKGRNQQFLSPSWTSDGGYVIASRSNEGIGTFTLWMYHKDGGNGVHVGEPEPPPQQPGSGQPQPPRRNKFGAVASPDGRYIYYAQRNGSFNYNAQFPIWQIVRFDRGTSLGYLGTGALSASLCLDDSGSL